MTGVQGYGPKLGFAACLACDCGGGAAAVLLMRSFHCCRVVALGFLV